MGASLLLPAFLLLLAQPAHAADLFLLDQRYGSIGFSVENFGAFSSQGTFPKFVGRLLIDRARPEQTTIQVEADATQIDMAWDDGAAMLRGPDFFDSARHPVIRFSSETITGLDPKHFRINGTLEMRGVRRPLTLDATLVRQAANPVSGTEIADFTVTGALSRAAWGMTAQTMMISDSVKLLIAARIELPAQTK